MSNIEPNSGPLSQAAVISFVFSAIQMAISSAIFMIAYMVQQAVSSVSNGSNSSITSGFTNPQSYNTAVILSGFGILGILIGFLAIGSIFSKGKTGVALTMSSFMISFPCVAFNFLPLMR